MRFSLRKSILAGLLTASVMASSLVATAPAFAAASSLTLESKAVANGATFNVTLTEATSIPTGGAQAKITFDAAKLTCNSAAYSTVYQANLTPVINNTTGVITNLAVYQMGGGPINGTNVLATLNFTAKAAAANSATTIVLDPTPIIGSYVTDANAVTLPTDLVNGVIVVGTVPTPDLTVSNVVATGLSGNLTWYDVSFRVSNSGTANAGACSSSLVIDGSEVLNPSIPAVAAGAFVIVTVPAAQIGDISGTNDAITVIVDDGSIIAESNETNNTGNGSYSYVAASGKTTDVNGDIVGTLTFTQPAAVEFGHLALGNNQKINPMNVLSNQSWNINVHGNAPTTAGGIDGKMTKWSSSPAPAGTYSATTKLHNALHVVSGSGYMGAPIDPTMTAPANYDVPLTGVDQLLANGIPEGQNPDGTSGETRNAIFNQTIIGSDAALASGFSYHIVVSFTASTTAW